MVYDWSVNYTHHYFGYSTQWASGGVEVSQDTIGSFELRFELDPIFIKLFKKR
jgi:hypothetical protein